MSSFKKLFQKSGDKKANVLERKNILEHRLELAKTNPEPVFDLSNCCITALPPVYALCRVFRKERLVLSHNNLSTIPDDHQNRLIDLANTVTHFDLNRNAITKIPHTIGCLSNLKELYLNHNMLTEIPSEIAQLKKLQVIELRTNLFDQFPAALCQVLSLVRIDLKGNEQINVLPDSLVKLKCLNELLIDRDSITYPPRHVLEQGIVEVIEYLKKKGVSNIENAFVELDAPEPVEISSKQSRDSSKDLDDAQYQDAYRLYVEKKDAKRQDRVSWEQQLQSDTDQQACLSGKQLAKKQSLLRELIDEQEHLAGDMHILQEKKIKDKASLISAIVALENHSKTLIDSIKRWQEKKDQRDKILYELEESNRELDLRQGEQITLRKGLVLKSIEHLIEDGSIDSLSGEGIKFKELFDSKKTSSDVLAHRILFEDELQRIAFELLQRDKDDQHRFISNQIKLVETELATLTQAELKRKTFKLETMINDVIEQRTELAGLLAQLIHAKEIRERELHVRLMQIQKLRDGEDDEFWLLQYQRLLRRQPLEDQLVHLNLATDVRLKDVLMSCNRDKIEMFLHVFVSNNIFQFDQLADKSDKGLMALGIDDYELAKDIVDQVDRIKKNGGPCAPSVQDQLVSDDSGEGQAYSAASAPQELPLDIFCQIECVICLDSKSNIIFFPCGHVCCCYACCLSFTLCPLCRETISLKRTFVIHDS